MALTRRQFIKRTGLAAAGSFLGPSLFRNPLLQQALASIIGDRYFVVVFLDGGNDALNTVTPVANGTSGTLRTAYQAARNTGAGGLRLPASGAGALLVPSLPFKDTHTNTQLGFHPGLGGASGTGGLVGLYNQGKVAVIQGCGYPDYSLSHETSRHTWQSAILGGTGSGWMGRYLAANYTGSDIPSVNVRNEIAGEFLQNTTSVLAIRRLANFNFPYDDFDSGDETAKRTGFLALYNEAKLSSQPTFKYTGDAGKSTLLATDNYPALVGLYNGRTSTPPGYPPDTTWSQAYANFLDTGFARNLREAARVIYGVSTGASGVNARFFEVANGGYDTHSDQGVGSPGDQQYELHREVGDAIELFYNDCVDMGVANKVCILIWSEFARRIQQNDNGTDHGSQGHMFVIGGAVNGGAYGNHPNINDPALDDDGNTVYSQAVADPYRSTDMRDVYGTILKHWLGMDGLGGNPDPLSVLTLDGGDPNLYWTIPNFDLGFI
jgi:uncharacterized protein (DUF1501 family)